MKSYTIGCRWEGHESVFPRLLDVMEIRGDYPRRAHRGRQTCWVLDYEFTSHGRYRASSSAMPWRSRLPHTAHLYPPGCDYWEDTRRETGYRHSAWICFVGGKVARLDRLLAPQSGYARFVDAHHQLGALLREIASIGRRKGDGGFWQAQAVFARIIDLLCRSRHDRRETYRVPHLDAVGPSDMVQAVERYLRTHIGDRIRLADLARHAHVSVSTLSHRFRRETGRSPIERLVELRIDHARMLILRGMPLKTIAARLAFTDEFHLSKTFKRIEGVSPRAFRNGRERRP